MSINKTFKFKSFGILTVLLLYLGSSLYAQEKREYERDAKKSDVPAVAKKWLNDAYEGRKKVRWYAETSNDKQSFEAKFKWKGNWHSVEFSETGVIEDIEVELDWDELPDALQQQLTNHFEQNYSKYDVKKIQKQYSGAPDDLEDLIDENENEGITIRYEIEFYGLAETDDELWEGLFDVNGQLISVRKIVLRATDNLDY